MADLFKPKSKKRINKRKRTTEDDSENEEISIDLAQLPQAQQPKLNIFKSDKQKLQKLDDVNIVPSTGSAVPIQYAGSATAYSEIDTEFDRDQRAVLERNIQINESGETNDETRLYRGQAAYRNYIKKDPSQIGMNKFTGTQGPVRAPLFIRSTCRFDYQPDICKDYKDTGTCGFGDNCKFIHDRGDYKSGWQLEKEWEIDQKKKKEREAQGLIVSDDENQYVIDSDDDLPFACFICREDFKNPIVTICGHYFCEKCALNHNKKSKRCVICGKQTGGVFNLALKLQKKIQLLDELKKKEAQQNKDDDIKIDDHDDNDEVYENTDDSEGEEQNEEKEINEKI